MNLSFWPSTVNIMIWNASCDLVKSTKLIYPQDYNQCILHSKIRVKTIGENGHTVECPLFFVLVLLLLEQRCSSQHLSGWPTCFSKDGVSHIISKLGDLQKGDHWVIDLLNTDFCIIFNSRYQGFDEFSAFHKEWS